MSLWQDIQFALRLFRKDRWFTIAAIAALSLGIGVNAGVFTFVNAVLLRGLPYEHADRLMVVWTENVRSQRMGVSPTDFEDWRQAKVLSLSAIYLGATVNVSDEGRLPERYSGAYISSELMSLIGQQPVLGRGFTADDDRPGAEPVVMLGHDLWRNRYASDPGVLGRAIKANSKIVTVIGVMPPKMQFPNNNDIWIPRAQLPPESIDPRRNNRGFNMLAQLAPGATIEQAQAEFKAIGARLAEAYPDTNKDLFPNLTSFDDDRSDGEIRMIFLALMGAVGLVLLIACANVANLLLARAASRAREISVRAALGAGRWRVVRQLLVESLLLAIASGALGLVMSLALIRWFDLVTSDVDKPYWMEFTLDPIVFAFIAGVSVLTAVLFGLAPALHVSKTNVNEVLKEGGRTGSGGMRTRRWSGALVIGEIVLTIALLAGAGFFMRVFVTMNAIEMGIDTSRLVVMQLYLPLTKYPQPGPRAELFQRFEERLAGTGSIEASAIATAIPLGGGPEPVMTIDGRAADPDTPRRATLVAVGDRYFDTVGVKLKQGRTFMLGDAAPGVSAIVNEAFIQEFMPGENPLDRIVTIASGGPPGGQVAGPMTIIGIAPNIQQRGPSDEDTEFDPVVYVPIGALPERVVTLIVRPRADIGSATMAAREALRAVEPDVPLYDVMTYDAQLQEELWPIVVFGTMFALFAVIALILSSVGLYAVTAYHVSLRRQEIGIRMALGASRKQILGLVFRRSFIQLGIGLPLGMFGAYWAGRLVQSLFVVVSPTDPATLGSVILVLAITVLFATWWPARRAAALDPMLALRDE